MFQRRLQTSTVYHGHDNKNRKCGGSDLRSKESSSIKLRLEATPGTKFSNEFAQDPTSNNHIYPCINVYATNHS